MTSVSKPQGKKSSSEPGGSGSKGKGKKKTPTKEVKETEKEDVKEPTAEVVEATEATESEKTTEASEATEAEPEPEKKSSKSKSARRRGKKKKESPADLKNRAPVVDPYGTPLTNDEERTRVEIKASNIPKGGNGVFALMDFAKDDVVCEFVGKRCSREEAYNQMMYAIEFTNDENETVLIDGWGYNNAAAIANDALGRTRLPRQGNNARFWHYGNRMFLCAKRNIRAGEEIFVQYGHEYWQMEKDAYHKVNMTDKIITLELDTCH